MPLGCRADLLLLLGIATFAHAAKRGQSEAATKTTALHRSPHGGYAKQDNATWKIPKCLNKKQSPGHLTLPKEPCGRDDLDREDICSLLASHPPPLSNWSLTSSARLHSDRRGALKQNVRPGARIVEIGTLTGALARFMVRELHPVQVIVLDLMPFAIKQCNTLTQRAARQVKPPVEVQCRQGYSQALLKELPDAGFDLVYVDADHNYKGVCADLEAAKAKVKVGGLMVLNDFFFFEYSFLLPRGRYGVYGVIHAAYEFLRRYEGEWEVAYYALADLNHGDFAMRRVR